jgi:hypothetical protein
MRTKLLLGAMLSMSTASILAQNPAPSAPKTCPVTHAPAPSDADQALAKATPEAAERLYAAMPPSSNTTAGIVRAQLAQRKLDEALALIQKENAAHPNDPVLLDVLGEVRFRRGEVVEAAQAYNQALKLDVCNARAHYDASRYMNLNGLYASGQVELNMAHHLTPDDPIIDRAWEPTQQVPLTPEQQIARLKDREANGSLTDEQKAASENTIKAVQAHQKGNCELVSPVATAKVPLYSTNPYGNNREPTSSGIDAFLNGKRRRFKLDTGASGLSISSNSVKALGLTPEAEVKNFGIGDSGQRDAYLTHIDTLKIGDLEFHNCMVEVFESKPGVRDQDILDEGLMGADVFRSFLVTLDLPGQEMRLSPLPKRPDEADTKPTLGTTGDQPEAGDASLTVAQRKKDRYIAPEMKDWTRVFRSGHDLIFPTSIGNVPRKLFIMDTGAGLNLISTQAAREVAPVTGDSSLHVHGISGDVKNVYGTGSIAISFANVRQSTFGMTAIDTSAISRGTGVEISGFIGYPLLRELVIQIDYRDNLVHVTYTPHIERGAH